MESLQNIGPKTRRTAPTTCESKTCFTLVATRALLRRSGRWWPAKGRGDSILRGSAEKSTRSFIEGKGLRDKSSRSSSLVEILPENFYDFVSRYIETLNTCIVILCDARQDTTDLLVFIGVSEMVEDWVGTRVLEIRNLIRQKRTLQRWVYLVFDAQKKKSTEG